MRLKIQRCRVPMSWAVEVCKQVADSAGDAAPCVTDWLFSFSMATSGWSTVRQVPEVRATVKAKAAEEARAEESALKERIDVLTRKEEELLQVLTAEILDGLKLQSDGLEQSRVLTEQLEQQGRERHCQQVEEMRREKRDLTGERELLKAEKKGKHKKMSAMGMVQGLGCVEQGMLDRVAFCDEEMRCVRLGSGMLYNYKSGESLNVLARRHSSSVQEVSSMMREKYFLDVQTIQSGRSFENKPF